MAVESFREGPDGSRKGPVLSPATSIRQVEIRREVVALIGPLQLSKRERAVLKQMKVTHGNFAEDIKRAMEGDPDAMYTIGNIFFDVEFDPIEAIVWYERAAQRGHEVAEKEAESLRGGLSQLQKKSEGDSL